jgi:hypothetical protein
MLTRLMFAGFAVSVLVSAAQAGPYGIRGNDTGGIIPYSPHLKRGAYLDIAAIHCARYNKLARITSIHRRYGDYVAFACQFDRYYDPVRELYSLRRLY